MSHPPAQLDTHLSDPGAGREYTFGQRLKIALRQFWRNKWRALGIALVVSFISAATHAGLNSLWWPTKKGLAVRRHPYTLNS